MNVKLSIGMMVKNEERWLERCLQALLPVLEAVDSELIVVDTGSEDRTVEIARRFTERVYSHPWQNDFSQMRNIVIGYARGEWFWTVDADEILETPQPVIDFLTSSRCKRYNAATVLIKNVTNEEDDTLHVPTLVAPRLFRKLPGFRYTGRVHNQPVYRGPIMHLPVTFLHYGYLATDKELMERKFQRTATLLKLELEKDPSNIYYWYQLSKSYAMHKDYEDAVDPILRAYELVKSKGPQSRNYMYVYSQLALLHFQLRRFRQVIRFCDEAIALRDGYPDLYYFKAKAHGAVGELPEAVHAYQRYLNIVRDFAGSPASKDTSVPHYSLYKADDARRDLVSLHHRLGNFEEAGEWALQVEAVDLLEPFFDKTVDSLLKAQRYQEIGTLYQRLAALDKPEVIQKFLATLERTRLQLDAELDRRLSVIFASGESVYSVLNAARVAADRSDLERHLSQLEGWSWREAPFFYGDLLYTLVREALVDWRVMTDLGEKHLAQLLTFAQRRHPDVPKVLANRLFNLGDLQTLAELRTAKALARYALLHGEWDDSQYGRLFERYIEWGTSYIEGLYRSEVLDGGLAGELKTDEEAALMLMRQAQLAKEDLKKQIEYLREAVNRFAPLTRGIRLQLAKLEEQLRVGEFERYKEKVKANIEALVQAGHLDEAQGLLQEYASVVPDDPGIYSVGSVIAVARGDTERALMLLDEGLRVHPDDFDLWFNRAYVYLLAGDSSSAVEAYRRAESLLTDDRQREDLANLAQQLSIV